MCGLKAQITILGVALLCAIVNPLRAQVVGTGVSVVASDPSATEGADSGVFTISRKGDTGYPLTVFFNVVGTATNGVDYQSLPTSVVIPPGTQSVRLEVTPVDDSLVETSERVVLRLAPSPLAGPGTAYSIIAPADAFVTIYDNDTPRPTNQPPLVRIVSPTNSAVFTAPTNIWIFAEPHDPDGTVETVEFFADSRSLGVVTNHPEIMTLVNPWNVLWTNVPPGAHTLRAVATDDKGAKGTSTLVSIQVRGELTNPVPTTVSVVATDRDGRELPVVPPDMDRPQSYDPAVFTFTRKGDTSTALTVYYTLAGSAKNGVDYEKLPGSVTIPAGAAAASVEVAPIDDSLIEGAESVEVAIEPPVCIAIYPPPPECYRVGLPSRAVAYIHDNDLPPATNRPPYVKIMGPADGSQFRAPADILLQANAGDADGFVASVAFFAGTNLVGQTTVSSNQPERLGPSLVYSLAWSNVPAGAYVVTAKATDNQGAITVSSPVRIYVGTNAFPEPPTNRLPLVSIYAQDAYAAEGTNRSSPNTATFVVRRQGNTNTSVVVYYSVAGLASNGVDFQVLSGSVDLPAGARAARVSITPLDDTVTEPTESVVLALQQPPFDIAPNYQIGFPAKAAGFIVDNDRLPPPTCRLADGLFHLCRPGTNGWPYRLECSTNLVDWIPLYTNQVVDGAIHYVEPDSTSSPQRFYRILPELTVPAE